MRAVFARGDAMLCVRRMPCCSHPRVRRSPRQRPTRRVCRRDELQALPKGTAHCAGALARRCNALHRPCAQLSCSEVVQPRFFAARVAQTRSISVQGCAAVIWTRSRTLDMVMR